MMQQDTEYNHTSKSQMVMRAERVGAWVAGENCHGQSIEKMFTNRPVRLALEILDNLEARALDISRRGTGLNGVWRVAGAEGPYILKIYSARRNALATRISDFTYRMAGISSYTPSGRAAIERTNLKLWRESGFDTPRILDYHLPDQFPFSYLCLELIDAPCLAELLLSDSVPAEEKDRVFTQFATLWGKRHEHALNLRNPRFIHKHGMFGHVFFLNDRFITFDLETCYVRSSNLMTLIVREICGYLRSLFKHLFDPAAIDHFLDLLIQFYPNRNYLEQCYLRFWKTPNPCLRVWYALDRMARRRRKQAMTKFEVAHKLHDHLL